MRYRGSEGKRPGRLKGGGKRGEELEGMGKTDGGEEENIKYSEIDGCYQNQRREETEGEGVKEGKSIDVF